MAYHHGDLRNALIAAAIPLLVDKGMTGLSLRELARIVGVGHAAPYRHFKNKRELLEAIAATGFNQLEQGCLRAMKKHPDDPAKQLTDGGLRYLLFAYENPAITNLMFGNFLSSGVRGDELATASENAMNKLVQIVANGQMAGIYRDGDVFDLTLAAWSMVHGLSMLTTSGMLGELAASKDQTKALGEKVSRLLLSGLLR